MKKMKTQTDSAAAAAAAAAAVSTPPVNVQLVQAEPQQSELQPTHSQELIIANLSQLSDALLGFRRCLRDLDQHIDSVRTSLESTIPLLLTPPSHTTNITPSPVTLPTPDPESEPEPEPSYESDPSEVESEDKDENYVDEDEDEEEEKEEEVKSPSRSELEILCERMNSIGLRRYMIRHRSDINGLREQVPKALKISPNPAWLVFRSINKGRERRGGNSSRGLATILALECFLLMMREANDEGRVVEIDKELKKDAEQTALAWRGRMIRHGGVSKTHKMDARGLLLLIGCFGIPQGFMDRDIRYLVQLSDARLVSVALRSSTVLMEKIPKIIKWMLKNNDMVVGAIDIVYTFGMENRFDTCRILTLFLRNSQMLYSKNTKGLEQGIPVCEGKKKHLSDLISVSKCLEDHKVDPSKLLTGWQIDVRIMTLEKDIAELNMHVGEKMAQKRKNDETELSGGFSNKEMKPSHIPNPNPWPPQQQRVANHVDDSNKALLERGGTAGHVYGYSLSPSVLPGAVPGSINGTAVGSMAGPVGGFVPMDGVGAGKSVKGGSCVGVHGGTLVDHTPGQIGSHTGQLYGPHGDAALHGRLASHTYAYRPSMGLPNTIPSDAFRPPPYLEGSIGLPNTIPGDAYRPTPYMESSKGLRNNIPGDANQPPPYMEGSAGLPNTITGDVYRPPPYSESSTGLPNIIPAPYQFANTVQATELYRSSGSRAVDAVPSSGLAHPSSSLYWKR